MIQIILRLARPIHLLLAMLTYMLGASIADYLGNPLRPVSFWLGLVIVLLAQTGMGWLTEVFRPFHEPIFNEETKPARIRLRGQLLNLSLAALATDVVLGFVLFNTHQLPQTAILSMFLLLIIIVAYSIPPIRLLNRGFGEFLISFQLAYVIPSVSFLLQAEQVHRLLFSMTIPLTLLGFAFFLILDFPSFAEDRKYQRVTLLRRLTWERAVPLHHSFITAAYVLFLGASFLGPSLSLLWPVFLSLPFAIFQIVLLRNLSMGGKPDWKLVTSTALGVFGLTAYFLTLTFWLR
jgi:1,4-dihydroxy-2-naphthoate octaprenyltransferase